MNYRSFKLGLGVRVYSSSNRMRDVSLDSLDTTRMRLFRSFVRVRLASSVGPLKYQKHAFALKAFSGQRESGR